MKYFKYKRNIRDYSEYPPTCLYLRNCQAIHLSFATIAKALSNKTAETFCERLK